jgi:hypothetical protein
MTALHKTTPPQPDDAFDRNAIHVMTFTAADAGAALSAVQTELATAGARLSGLSLSAFDQVVEGVLRLTDISSATARACSDRLATRPGVLGARVEHHLFRP